MLDSLSDLLGKLTAQGRIVITIELQNGLPEVSTSHNGICHENSPVDQEFVSKRYRPLSEVLDFFEWPPSKAETLRNRIRRDEIKGIKEGGRWLAETQSCLNYLNNIR